MGLAQYRFKRRNPFGGKYAGKAREKGNLSMSLMIDIKKKIGNFSLDISFETDSKISGILGASGCGKSLALMCIAGIVVPDSGKIILNDKVVFDSERRINIKPQERQIGYLFQNYALFPHMTVSQNILCGMHKQKRKECFQEIIELTRLNGLEARRPSQLSGGQQQRVALARILAGEPELILLDEPFSAIDSFLREELRAETQKLLKRYDKEAFLVSHSRDEIYSLCEKTALIDEGKLLAYNDTKELFRDPGSCQAAILTGCKNIARARRLSEYTVEAYDWGVVFTTARPVAENLCAIGIRARHFKPSSKQNSFPVSFVSEIENPFEYNYEFRYNSQNAESSGIRWLFAKEKKPEPMPLTLGIEPEDIMLLYG
jgi:molybdate transport system ATP-binding protein